MDRIPHIVGNTVGYNRRNLRTMRLKDNTTKNIRKISDFSETNILEVGSNFPDIQRGYLKSSDSMLIGNPLFNTSEVVL